jgi:hypothetical protein
LIEAGIGELLGVVLAFGGAEVFLIAAVVMVAEFVHEDVEECERASLGLSEAASNGFFFAIVGNA